MTYDARCYDLAEEFLSDALGRKFELSEELFDHFADELAQVIQNAIEEHMKGFPELVAKILRAKEVVKEQLAKEDGE